MHDDWIDSLRYCTFIGGRHCGKTELAKELARHLLNSNYGLASADNWAQRYLYTVDKLYDTLGIKDYLNKVYGDPMLKFKNGNYIDYMPSGSKSLKETAKKYGCDLDFTINWDIEREEETNNMRKEYCFGFKNDADVLHKIEIDRRRLSSGVGDEVYHVRLYRSAAIGWDFIRVFLYRTWDQLSTQLMCDLYAFDVRLRRSDMASITDELYMARREFCERRQLNYADLTQPREKKDEVRFTAPYNAMPKIKKVIFNPPATIVKWKDGTKTIVKCQDDDEFDWEKGLAMAYVKRAFNNDRTYYGLFKKNEPCINLPNSNVKYDPNLAKEVRIIVPKDLPVTGDIIMKAHDLIMKEGDKKWENGISLGQ